MPKKPIPFKAAYEKFLLASRAAGRSERTIETYHCRLDRLVAKFGHLPVTAIDVDMLRVHVVELRESELKPMTVYGHVKDIKMLFNWIVSEEFLDQSPAARIINDKPEEVPPKAIKIDDVVRMLEAAERVGKKWEQKRNRAIVLLLIDTGCRVSGAITMSLEELDLKERYGIVREKKGDWRFVFLSPSTKEAIDLWLQFRERRHNVASSNFCVFVNRNGKQLTRFGIAQMLKRLARQAEVYGPCNAHAFRHGFAIDYLMEGGDLATLCDLMGHKDVHTTKKFYARFLMGHLQAAHRRNSPVNRLPDHVL